MFDVCIVGPVTVDRIEAAGHAPLLRPGGTACYAGAAAHALGLRTAVVTKAAPADRPFFDAALAGLDVRWRPSPVTTRFVNAYPGADLDERVQRVTAVAEPLRPEDVDVAARWFVLGPLIQGDLAPACVEALAGRGGRVALDVQGLLRTARGAEVVPAPFDGLGALLAHVDVLKASEDEALFATGSATAEAAAAALAALGPAEVLVTSGSRGSLVHAGGASHPIPAYPPAALVDTTGCGDTYLAAYLAGRLAGLGPAEAGHAAAEVAAAKIGTHGPFRPPLPEGVRRALAPARPQPQEVSHD